VRLRLVARGFTQRGVDYSNVFSLVVKHKSIWMLLVMIVELNLELKQIDIKPTSLYGDLKETISVKQLKGFEVKDNKDYVNELKRSLYGPKQFSK